MLTAVHEAITPYVEPFDLREPNPDELELARKLIAKAVE